MKEKFELWKMDTNTQKYNSETDYKIILEAARTAGEIYITPIALALREANIEWPKEFYKNSSPEAIAIDKDIGRAWRELGYKN